MMKNPAAIVERFTDLHATLDQFFTELLDIWDNQVETLRRAWRSHGDVPAEDNRAPRAGRGKLDHPVGIACCPSEIQIEPPTQALIESLDLIDVGNRDDDDLQPHIQRACAHGFGRVCFILGCAHLSLREEAATWPQ